MLIIGQRKDVILPMEKFCIGITRDNKIVATHGLCDSPDKINNSVIGIYSTREKALKVVSMIVEAYNAIETMKIDGCAWRENHMFFMPEDNEVQHES